MLSKPDGAPTRCIVAAAIVTIAASGSAPTGCVARDATSNAFLQPVQSQPAESGQATHPGLFNTIPPGTLLRLQLADTSIL